MGSWCAQIQQPVLRRADRSVRNGTQLATVRDARGHSSLAIIGKYVNIARHHVG
jgi:hypothetical protein